MKETKYLTGNTMFVSNWKEMDASSEIMCSDCRVAQTTARIKIKWLSEIQGEERARKTCCWGQRVLLSVRSVKN